ncbi:MAG: DUF3857 domain-containing protein [Bacteroidota bacterium]
MKLTLFLALLLGYCTIISGQYDNFRYGRISDEEMALSEAPGFPDADAYTLFDRLAVSMMLSSITGQFELRETVNRRVKLFKESSFDRADIVIRYYDGMDLGSLKAAIHLPDGREVKLRNGDFNRDEVQDGLYECRFTFPQVTEGAIIEYTYELRSQEFNFDRLPTYYFQEDIPCRWSEYTVTKPNGFTYVDLANMTEFDVQETDVISRAAGSGGQPLVYSFERYVMKEVPPLEIEPYTNNINDYMPRIVKQLQFINWQGFSYDPEMSSWGDLAEDIRNSNLRRYTVSRTTNGQFMQALEPLMASATTETEKAMVIYRLLNNSVVWDGRYRFVPGRSPNQVWGDREGSSAEINALLLHALKQNNIEAHPLFVGLRGRGNAMEFYPLRDQFDHMLVVAKLDDNYQILDVAGHALPFGYARPKVLNHRAWLVADDSDQWISIEPPAAEETVLAEVSLLPDGMATAKIQSRAVGYFAATTRGQMVDVEDPVEGPYMSKIAERYPEVELVEEQLPSSDNPNGPYNYTLEVNAPIGEAIDDHLYVSPLLLDLISSEIVEDEERTYPIDLPYGFRKRYICSMMLPEGYEVAELPESSAMRSEDGSVSCRFSITQTGTTLSLNLEFQVLRTQFAPEEYDMFRELFRQVNELQESVLVLRKVK